MRRHLLVVTGVLLLTPVFPLSARVELTPPPRSVTEAIDIGQSRIESLRTRFHQPYRIPVMRPPIDYLEIVTPFRRIVLAAETRAGLGDRGFSQREALASIDGVTQQIEVIVEMTFHPHNTYIGVPGFELRLLDVAAGGVAIDPLTIDRLPRFGPRVAGMPLPVTGGGVAAPGGVPLAGGALAARFDGVRIGNLPYDLVVLDSETELVRARINFRELR